MVDLGKRCPAPSSVISKTFCQRNTVKYILEHRTYCSPLPNPFQKFLDLPLHNFQKNSLPSPWKDFDKNQL